MSSGDPGLGSNDKTSLVMAVLDQPGSLLGALQPLAARGINLHKLESHPMRGKPFEYVIYVNMMVAGDDPGLADALEEMAGHTSMLRVLGSYRAAPRPCVAVPLRPHGFPHSAGARLGTPLARRFRFPSSCSCCCWASGR